MSGIAALCHWDGQPIDDTSIARMLDAISHRGPDARGIWHSGSVALGHVTLWSDPGSPAGREAIAAADGVCVVFDGRLDNRRELSDRLRDAGIRACLRTQTDATLVLLAYRLWEHACVSKLFGDFALVVFDATRRQLLCARDPVGMRPLVYYTDGRRFIAGSETHQLFVTRAFAPEPNEGMVGEYLYGRITNREETLYRNVFRLAPAEILIASTIGIRKFTYYDPYPVREIQHRTDGECAEHFRSVLSEAIRCRVPAAGSLGAYLSGGLDSSSIICLAEHMRREGQIRDVPLVTLSMIGRTPAGDESRYVDAVVRQWALKSYRIEPTPADPQMFVDQVTRYRDMPEYPNVAAVNGLASAARGEQCRVLLTGLGGDDWLCAPYSHCAELLAKGRLHEFFEQLAFENGLGSSEPLWTTFVRRGLYPLLPRRCRALLSRGRRRRVPPHIEVGFARAVALLDRTNHRSSPQRSCASRTQQELYDWFWSGSLPYINEADDLHHARLGIDARHPFHDRRVIEFALALPERQRWRSTQTKFVLRRALGDLLPAEVSSREVKGDYSHMIADALDASGGERCFEELESARRGWVRPDVVRETYRRMRVLYEKGDEQYSADTFGLWTVYGVELWLKHAFN